MEIVENSHNQKVKLMRSTNGTENLTIIYDDYYLDSTIFPAEAESTKRLLNTMKTLGWNFLPASEAKREHYHNTSNFIGLYICKNENFNEIFSDTLKNIPLLFLHYEFNSQTTLEVLDRCLKEYFETKLVLGIPQINDLGTLYIEKIDGKLKYSVITPERRQMLGTLDLNINADLTPDVLNAFKSQILEETSNKGHTPPTDSDGLKRFRGLLITPSEQLPLPSITEAYEEKIKFIMPWVPTVQQTTLSPSSGKKELMWAGGKWSNQRLTDIRYLDLWRQLDQRLDFHAYGHSIWKDHCPETYKGYVEGDGESFIRKINEHGICLVLHSESHLKVGIPSGRIFEAAAASAIIICDNHSYVKEKFKDSVLYIDHTAPDLYAEIAQHLDWIEKNIIEAKQKAINAHEIFNNNLTLECQLKELHKNLREARLI